MSCEDQAPGGPRGRGSSPQGQYAGRWRSGHAYFPMTMTLRQ